MFNMSGQLPLGLELDLIIIRTVSTHVNLDLE